MSTNINYLNFKELLKQFSQTILNEVNNHFTEQDYFITLAAMIAMKSPHPKYKFGSIIVLNEHIKATGFNYINDKRYCIRYNILNGIANNCDTFYSEMSAIRDLQVNMNLNGASIYTIGYDVESNRFIRAKINKQIRRCCMCIGLYKWITKSDGLSGSIISMYVDKANYNLLR